MGGRSLTAVWTVVKAAAPAAVAVVVSGAWVSWPVIGWAVGTAVGTILAWRVGRRGDDAALAAATVVTAVAMSDWGWGVEMAMVANWLSWQPSPVAVALSLVAWIAVGLLCRQHWAAVSLAVTGLSASIVWLWLWRRKS